MIRSVVAPARLREVASVVALTLFLGVYEHWTDLERPRPSGSGYLGWWDQSQYLALARILASGRLPTADEYTYGLGLPVLGVPGVWLGATDPFVAPSLAMTAIAMAALYIAAMRIVGRLFAVVSVAFVLLFSPLVGFAVVPWSSTVIVFCASLGLLAITMPSPPTGWRFAALGALTGLGFAARYIDVVLLAALVGVALLLDGTGRRFAHALAAAAPAAAIAAAVAATHWVAFGDPMRTPYASHMRGEGENATSDQSFQQYQVGDIPEHFWETFIAGTHNGIHVAQPLVLQAPWLLLVPAGVALVFMRRDRWFPLHAVMVPVTVLLSMVYLSFAAGGGSDLPYWNPRYWLPMFPYWSILAAFAARAFVDWATGSGEHAQPTAALTAKGPGTTAPSLQIGQSSVDVTKAIQGDTTGTDTAHDSGRPPQQDQPARVLSE